MKVVALGRSVDLNEDDPSLYLLLHDAAVIRANAKRAADETEQRQQRMRDAAAQMRASCEPIENLEYARCPDLWTIGVHPSA